LLENIAVAPSAQNTGLGSRLLRLAEQHALAMGPEIRLYTNEVPRCLRRAARCDGAAVRKGAPEWSRTPPGSLRDGPRSVTGCPSAHCFCCSNMARTLVPAASAIWSGGGPCEQRPVHADRQPSSQPLCRTVISASSSRWCSGSCCALAHRPQDGRVWRGPASVTEGAERPINGSGRRRPSAVAGHVCPSWGFPGGC
jgi:hypothetical protein